ncbi:hypothetical protein [Polaribacter atrinae]|uniref:Uncharacterized protein n=1 Tax=Polaribacter atrinae TaxID=1333662 RepID=A0A176TCH9_9FLAO|nr:hypothetical protein [Polaribacter atrinae]OAD45597.1 hypothetical protein LPB303_06560 [Polaribacter atrinae]
MNIDLEIEQIVEKGKLITEGLKEYKNTIVNLDDLEELYKKLDKLYCEIHVYYRVNNSESFDFFYKLYSELEELFELKKDQEFADKAMEEYRSFNSKNEINLIEWILKYQRSLEHFCDNSENEYNLYQKLNTTKLNVIVDITKYKNSYEFNIKYWNHWLDIYFKYRPEKDKDLNKIKEHTIENYLIYHNKYIEIIKKYNKNK